MPYITPVLDSFENKEFSQFGEDGVVAKLALDLGVSQGTYFEFGIGPSVYNDFSLPLEGNCVALRQKGWRGVLLDCCDLPTHYGVRRDFITALNINTLYVKHDVPLDLDFLSIDVDGQEFWIWMALQPTPKVVIVEYNACLGPDVSQTTQFDTSHTWDGSIYQGASLSALEKLAISKGYTLVFANGVNAFFVRNNCISNISDFANRCLFKYFPYAEPHGPDSKQRSWVQV